ncbi:MAG: hypothetical protein V4773_04025 [Verrucomicrobiota bacterium]
MLTIAPIAEAYDCAAPDVPTGAAPGSLDCSPTGGAQVCIPTTVGGVTTLDCGTGRFGGAGNAVAHLTYWNDGSQDGLTCWGTTASGDDFCCREENLAALVEADLHGAGGNDDLALAFHTPFGPDIDLRGWVGHTVIGYVFGKSGTDRITGSLDAGVLYTEELYGEGDADTILGRGGSDLIDAGGGNDQVSAGPGADEVYGGDGNDLVCMGIGTGELADGGLGDDVLYDPAAASTLYDGGAGTDQCSTATDPGCEGPVVGVPVCPI